MFEDFFESRRIRGDGYGQYLMRSTDSAPDYYGSLDVAISRTLMGEDLKTALSDADRQEWIRYLHKYARQNGTYCSTYGHFQLHANGMTVGA